MDEVVFRKEAVCSDIYGDLCINADWCIVSSNMQRPPAIPTCPRLFFNTRCQYGVRFIPPQGYSSFAAIVTLYRIESSIFIK